MHAALSALVSAALGVASQAQAAIEPLPFVASVKAEAGCPEVARFSERLLVRSRHVRAAVGGEPALRYSLSVAATPGGYQGHLQILDIEGRRTERSVTGETCEGVIDALALVAAVLVEQEEARPLPPRESPEGSGTAISGRGGSGLGVGFGATLELNSAAGPQIAPGLGMHLLTFWQRPSPWAPELRLGLVVRGTSSGSSSVGEGSFDGWAARVSLSPLEWPQGRSFVFRPALGLELGRLTAQGEEGVPDADSAAIPWLAPELSAAGRLQVIGPLAATAEVSLLVPVYRDSFYFDSPDARGGRETVFTVPPVGIGARIGLVAVLR